MTTWTRQRSTSPRPCGGHGGSTGSYAVVVGGALKWAGDRLVWKAGAAREDVVLAEQALHIVAQGQLPLDGGSSRDLND